MNPAREEILERIREALADVTDPAQPQAAPRIVAPSSQKALIDLFVERVADYQAVVERCSADEVEARVAAALPAAGENAPRAVVPAELGIEVADAVVDHGALSALELDRIPAVVTRCRVGIAETGTIVLDHTADQGRRAISLVPDLHVCVVSEAQVVADVPDALPLLDPVRPQTWVSGPSATSDIELSRVEGVHGPRTLHVLLVSHD